MKKLITWLVTLGLGVGLLAGTALAAGHDSGRNDWPEGLPPHGHIMLIGVEVDNGDIYFDRCVELAAGKALRGSAHHDSVHTGVPGGSPFAGGVLFEAGNWVIPLMGLTPFTGCEDFSSPFSF